MKTTTTPTRPPEEQALFNAMARRGLRSCDLDLRSLTVTIAVDDRGEPSRWTWTVKLLRSGERLRVLYLKP